LGQSGRISLVTKSRKIESTRILHDTGRHRQT